MNTEPGNTATPVNKYITAHKTTYTHMSSRRYYIFFNDCKTLQALHSLHVDLCLPCSQMDTPPHSLQSDLRLLCSQMPDPRHSLH